MACIDHTCKNCGEVWCDNSLYGTCPRCKTFNKGYYDEEIARGDEDTSDYD